MDNEDGRICIRLPPELRNDLRKAYECLGGRESDIIRDALKEYLKKILPECDEYEAETERIKRILEQLKH